MRNYIPEDCQIAGKLHRILILLKWNKTYYYLQQKYKFFKILSRKHLPKPNFKGWRHLREYTFSCVFLP